MLTYLTALIATLASVPYCPPETGQLRWDVRHEFTVERTYAARGAVWDRDQNGTPSKGDVFRIEAGWVGGNPLPFEELWTVLGEALARDMAGRVAATPEVKVVCESTLAINEEPPVMATNTALPSSAGRSSSASRASSVAGSSTAPFDVRRRNGPGSCTASSTASSTTSASVRMHSLTCGTMGQ